MTTSEILSGRKLEQVTGLNIFKSKFNSTSCHITCAVLIKFNI